MRKYIASIEQWIVKLEMWLRPEMSVWKWNWDCFGFVGHLGRLKERWRAARLACQKGGADPRDECHAGHLLQGIMPFAVFGKARRKTTLDKLCDEDSGNWESVMQWLVTYFGICGVERCPVGHVGRRGPVHAEADSSSDDLQDDSRLVLGNGCFLMTSVL